MSHTVNLRHKICALFLLALWLPYFGHCIQPHCQEPFVGETCETHHHHGNGEHEEGQHDADCHQHDPTPPVQVHSAVLPPPALGLLAAWMELIPEPPLRLDPVLPEDDARSGPPPPLQTVLARAALPVRGPSA